MKKLFGALGLVLAVVLGLGAWNYFGVYGPVSKRLAEDERNQKVSVWAYRELGVSTSTIVFDLRGANDDAAAVDVTRALFQASESLKDSRFERVVLAHRGEAKLYVQGEYFQTLGQSFNKQNPVYLLRTLPENVHKLDGSKAYGTWTGGVLGVFAKQMEDLSSMAKDWYLEDMGALAAKKP